MKPENSKFMFAAFLFFNILLKTNKAKNNFSERKSLFFNKDFYLG